MNESTPNDAAVYISWCRGKRFNRNALDNAEGQSRVILRRNSGDNVVADEAVQYEARDTTENKLGIVKGHRRVGSGDSMKSMGGDTARCQRRVVSGRDTLSKYMPNGIAKSR
jgi:hypothetical protein